VSKWTQSGPYSYKHSSTYTPTHTHKQPLTHKHTNTTRTHNRTHTNETIQHTYTHTHIHTHIHTHTPTCVCARPQMARRARGPIWTAIYSDQNLEVHRIVDPRVCCPMCATDDEGRVKPGCAFKIMHHDQAAAHVRGAGHQRRLTEGRAVPGPVLVPVMGVVCRVVCCHHCCLTKQGHRREKHYRMDGPTALAHVGTEAHARRVVEDEPSTKLSTRPEQCA
jgi:hypothetical protein